MHTAIFSMKMWHLFESYQYIFLFCRETRTHVEMEICVSQIIWKTVWFWLKQRANHGIILIDNNCSYYRLKCPDLTLTCVQMNNLHCIIFLIVAFILSSVSDCRKIQDSCLFHKGDQILAFNDLLIDTVEEIQTYVKRLSKNEVRWWFTVK